MRVVSTVVICLVIVVLASQCSFFAKPAVNIHVGKIFSDNMVLQRGMDCPVWGTADAGGKVTVSFRDQKKTAIANKEGKWKVTLSPMDVGKPGVLVIAGADTLTFRNVLVGEVWLASGQSNMEMPLDSWGEVLDFEKEIANANYPDIRLFQVEHATSLTPLTDLGAVNGWDSCSPSTVPFFSSTAYFFGRYLYKELKVPIGLIHSSWGGTNAESWVSAASLKKLPDFAQVVQNLESGLVDAEALIKEYEEKMAAWKKAVDDKVAEAQQIDLDIWRKSPTADADWPKMKLPVLWEKAGLEDFDGVVWFRKSVDIPATWVGADLTLRLAAIDDIDDTWMNGVRIGGIANWTAKRIYSVPAAAVHAGANLIAVRVIDTGGGGGIWGQPEEMCLENAAGEKISLAGEWRYKPGITLAEIPPQPVSPEDKNRPMVLNNAMIEPLIPFAIRGVIWYQGENNVGRAYQYRDLFKTLIQDWRQRWGEGDFPFLFVQLANFMARAPQPSEHPWAELREAQLMALELPNTGMAVAIDIGDAEDIHPKNKQEVGRRLALNALKLVYGKDVVYSGPIYKSMTAEGNKIRIAFDHTGGGLVAKDKGKLLGFAIAGADKKWVWADAVISGDKVIVSSDYVPQPVAVRYAWAANPLCNLYNKEGLPASPFRTDDWLGVTVDSK
jgi:sialate O-acetylesterase